MVENDLIAAAVDKELKGVGNVQVRSGARVKDYKLGDVKKVVLESGDEISCELLVSTFLIKVYSKCNTTVLNGCLNHTLKIANPKVVVTQNMPFWIVTGNTCTQVS